MQAAFLRNLPQSSPGSEHGSLNYMLSVELLFQILTTHVSHE